jgi:hypothetical protein
MTFPRRKSHLNCVTSINAAADFSQGGEHSIKLSPTKSFLQLSFAVAAPGAAAMQ